MGSPTFQIADVDRSGLSARRQAALDALAEVVPSHYGDARFTKLAPAYKPNDPAWRQRLLDAGFNPDHYTTCGELPRFVGDRIGIKTKGGLESIRQIGRDAGAWVELSSGRQPKPGDFYMVTSRPDGKGDVLHVGVVLAVRDGVLVTADAGQGGHGDQQAADVVERPYDRATGELGKTGSHRYLAGWLDVNAVPVDGVVDHDPEAIADGGGDEGGDSALPAALAFAGLALLVGGGLWYASSKRRGVNALAERDDVALAIAWADFLREHDRIGVTEHAHVSSELHLLPEPQRSSFARYVYDGFKNDLDVWGEEGDPRVPALLVQHARREHPSRGLLALSRGREGATVNLAAQNDGRDFEARTRFERALGRAGFEVTGAGTGFGAPDALGRRRVMGTDVDVECAGACDQEVLREIADRAGVVVDSITPWRS